MLPEGTELPSIQSLLLFAHPQIELNNLEEAPIPALNSKDLKDFLREKKQGKIH